MFSITFLCLSLPVFYNAFQTPYLLSWNSPWQNPWFCCRPRWRLRHHHPFAKSNFRHRHWLANHDTQLLKMLSRSLTAQVWNETPLGRAPYGPTLGVIGAVRNSAWTTFWTGLAPGLIRVQTWCQNCLRVPTLWSIHCKNIWSSKQSCTDEWLMRSTSERQKRGSNWTVALIKLPPLFLGNPYM